MSATGSVGGTDTGTTATTGLAGQQHDPGRVAQWWRDVGSAALLGTARRPVPALPDLGVPGLALPAGLRSEDALLSAAALGAAARRAGEHPTLLDPAAESGADALPPPSRLAVQLLELVLNQPPAGAQQRVPLLLHWLACAASAGQRVPHALLPTLLGLATGNRELRPPAALALDTRGEWLAAQNPDWAWVPDALAAARARAAAARAPVSTGGDGPEDAGALAAAPPTEVEWALLPATERPAVLGILRGSDPSLARALVESTWSTDNAKERRAHLDALRVGLSQGDEALLERALDDRAASVREGALSLLDALPGSARAARMAERLRPLLHTKGLLMKSLEVSLPDEPDAAAKRDGLGKPPPRRSARGWWLERIAAAAPLEVWTSEVAGDPATVLSRLSDEDALAGIRDAVRLRRDPTWAAAVLGRVWAPELVPVLRPELREQVVLARLGTGDLSAVALIGHVPASWTQDFSVAVLERLQSSKTPSLPVAQAMPHLVRGLHPGALGALEAWLARVGDDLQLMTNLRNLLQFHSVKRSITEAFR